VISGTWKVTKFLQEDKELDRRWDSDQILQVHYNPGGSETMIET